MSTDSFPVVNPPRSAGFALPARTATRRLQLDELVGSRWAVVVGLALLVPVSVWLRTRAMYAHYWIDEGISVGIASHPLREIPSLMRQDGSPPLYYLLLHIWMAIRGRGEVATHELSLIFALLTIPVAYWAGESLFGRRAGVMGAVIAAGVPYLTLYGQETRMYAMMTLLSLIVAASFLHAFVERRRRYLPVFSVSLAAALYTHNWAIFLAGASLLAFVISVWWVPRTERRALWRDGLLAFGGVAILFAAWVPTLLYQARHTGAPWDLPPVLWSISQGLYQIVGGRGSAVALLLAGGVGFAGLWEAVGGGRGAAALRERPSDPNARLVVSALCLLMLSLGTMLIAWLYSKHSPAWTFRYFAAFLGPLLLLFVLGLSRAGRLGVVALALTVAFWVLGPMAHTRNSKSNVGLVAAKVRHQLGTDPLVLSTQPEQVPTLAYYLPRVTRFGTTLGPVGDRGVVDWRNALSRLRRSSLRTVLMPMVHALRPGERLLLVVPVHSATQPLWLGLIGRYSKQWTRALEHDRALKLLKVTSADWTESPVGVRATLYEKR